MQGPLSAITKPAGCAVEEIRISPPLPMLCCALIRAFTIPCSSWATSAETVTPPSVRPRVDLLLKGSQHQRRGVDGVLHLAPFDDGETKRVLIGRGAQHPQTKPYGHEISRRDQSPAEVTPVALSIDGGLVDSAVHFSQGCQKRAKKPVALKSNCLRIKYNHHVFAIEHPPFGFSTAGGTGGVRCRVRHSLTVQSLHPRPRPKALLTSVAKACQSKPAVSAGR